MKKTFSLVALLLAVIMIAMCCVACGDDKKSDDAAAPTTVDGTDTPAVEEPVDVTTASIVGLWKTSIDFDSMIEAMMQAQGGDVSQETADLYQKMFSGVVISFTFKFDADSSCELEMDKDSMSGLLEKIKTNIKANMSEILAMSGLTEQDLADNGYTVDSYADMIVSSFDISTFDQQDKKGTYRLDGNKLYVFTEDNPNNENYVEIELTANTLSIVGGSGIDEDSALFAEAMLPLVFTRA